MVNEKDTEMLEEAKVIEKDSENDNKAVEKNENIDAKDSYEKIEEIENGEEDLTCLLYTSCTSFIIITKLK